MIETIGLTKRYKQVVALDHVDLAIDAGEIFGYIGPNGAGKTTTIRILCGLLRPTEGSARVAGVDVVAAPRKARDVVGYMPDAFGVYAGMRVWEYLDFFGAAYRLPRAQRSERVESVLDLTGTEAMRDYFVDTLSHGMRQRVGLAKTLIHDPQVVLLDEPTNGLDPRARVEMRELLKRLKALGKTLIVSSHILPELASVCDRIGILERGQLLACGTVDEVMKTVQQRRVLDIELLDGADKAADFLRGEAPSCEVESVVGRLVRVSFDGHDRAMAELLDILVRKGHPVVGMNEVMMDLETVYMKVTEAAKAGSRRTEADG